MRSASGFFFTIAGASIVTLMSPVLLPTLEAVISFNLTANQDSDACHSQNSVTLIHLNTYMKNIRKINPGAMYEKSKRY
jgi:hypothetical protein